jgi:adenylate cyclase class 2
VPVIEAELKARVRDPDHVRGLLRSRAAERLSTYHDTYYDQPGRSLTREGRELRLRIVDTGEWRRSVLTYKGLVVDPASGSKTETETEVGDPCAVDAILLALGFAHLVAFDKYCANYAFIEAGREILATMVTVSELDGTFVEVETMAADAGEFESALAVVRAILRELGITEGDITTELYTDAVMARRQTT